MADPLTDYVERMCIKSPDLQIDSARLNNDGLINTVVVINDEMVFRFAKCSAT